MTAATLDVLVMAVTAAMVSQESAALTDCPQLLVVNLVVGVAMGQTVATVVQVVRADRSLATVVMVVQAESAVQVETVTTVPTVPTH